MDSYWPGTSMNARKKNSDSISFFTCEERDKRSEEMCRCLKRADFFLLDDAEGAELAVVEHATRGHHVIKPTHIANRKSEE